MCAWPPRQPLPVRTCAVHSPLIFRYHVAVQHVLHRKAQLRLARASLRPGRFAMRNAAQRDGRGLSVIRPLTAGPWSPSISPNRWRSLFPQNLLPTLVELRRGSSYSPAPNAYLGFQLLAWSGPRTEATGWFIFPMGRPRFRQPSRRPLLLPALDNITCVRFVGQGAVAVFGGLAHGSESPSEIATYANNAPLQKRDQPKSISLDGEAAFDNRRANPNTPRLGPCLPRPARLTPNTELAVSGPSRVGRHRHA